MGHNTNGPSVFFRRKLCPGSKRMEAKFPGTDNEHSLRGTACHKVAEMCFNEGKTPGYWLNQVIEVPKVDGSMYQYTFNAEDNDAVWAYINYVGKREVEIPNCIMEIEEEADPGPWLGRDDVAGTADCVLLWTTVTGGAELRAVEVIDYKHGSGVAVEAKDNPQIAEYILGTLVRIDWAVTPHDIPVTGTIVQPRCPHPEGPIRSWTMPANYFFGLVEEHRAAAAATDDPEAPLVPGDAQCRFCKAKGDCPARTEAAMGAFAPVAGTPSQDTSPWTQVENALGQPVEMLSLEAKVAIKDKAPMISAWLKGIEESLLRDAMEGTEVPGYKLVETRKNRKWDMEDEDLIKKLASLRNRDNKALGKAMVSVTKPLSIAQSERIIKPLISERSWKGVEKIVISPPGAPTLVPLTDPRPAIKQATEAFQPITEENPFG